MKRCVNPIMKYKLLAADMDGTLLNDQSQITQHTKDALLSAADAGVIFVASTGRPMCGVESVNALFTQDFPFIIFNGAMAVMGKSGNVLFSKPLDFGYAKEIYKLGVDRNIPTVLWTENELFVSCESTVTQNYQTISGVVPSVIEDIEQFQNKHICKMIWIDNPDGALQYQFEMTAHFGGKVNCHISRPHFLEFVNADASKGLALSEIGRIYGIDKSEMIAVGDSYNDISMLEYVGLGVAMANAPKDIQKICRHVTLSNNDDGVAAAINRYWGSSL